RWAAPHLRDRREAAARGRRVARSVPLLLGGEAQRSRHRGRAGKEEAPGPAFARRVTADRHGCCKGSRSECAAGGRVVERVALADLHTVVAGQRWYARVAHGGGARGESPVLLVHGFGISSSYFVPAARRLGAIFDVYAPDLPGHGKSDTPPRALDVPALASALREWCAAVGIERARVVANSMGCQTAAELALREPDFVERLVLIGPTVDTAAR